jgi:hypothetical protein
MPQSGTLFHLAIASCHEGECILPELSQTLPVHPKDAKPLETVIRVACGRTKPKRIRRVAPSPKSFVRMHHDGVTVVSRSYGACQGFMCLLCFLFYKEIIIL